MSPEWSHTGHLTSGGGLERLASTVSLNAKYNRAPSDGGTCKLHCITHRFVIEKIHEVVGIHNCLISFVTRCRVCKDKSNESRARRSQARMTERATGCTERATDPEYLRPATRSQIFALHQRRRHPDHAPTPGPIRSIHQCKMLDTSCMRTWSVCDWMDTKGGRTV